MAFAGDVLIMRKRSQDVNEVFTSLVEQIKKVGLQIKKTEFMIISREPYNENKYVKLWYMYSFYFNQQCRIHIFYFNNIYVIITPRFNTFVSYSGSSKLYFAKFTYLLYY